MLGMTFGLLVSIADPSATVQAQRIADGPGPDMATYQAKVLPFMKKTCFGCHGEKAHENDGGGIRLDNLDPLIDSGEKAEQWQEIQDVVSVSKMPGRKWIEQHGPPSQKDVESLVFWVTGEIRRAKAILESTGGKVVLRRINKREYNNTIRDLLGVEDDFSREFPDEVISNNFDNIGSALGFSPYLLGKFMSAAATAVEKAVPTGPSPMLQVFRNEKEGVQEGSLAGAQRHDGNLVIVGTRLARPLEVLVSRGSRRRGLRIPQDGWYQIRIKASKFRGAGKEVIARLFHGSGQTGKAGQKTDIAMISLTDQMKQYSFDALLKKNEFVNLVYQNPELTQGGRAADIEEATASWNGVGLMIESYEIKGPIHEMWPPRSYRLVMGEPKDSYSETDAKEILTNFAARAYRRPPRREELTALHRYYDRKFDENGDAVESIKATIVFVLSSPGFIYHEQTDRLDDFALASRLSYFLWGSMPDAELFRQASAGTLSVPEVLDAQVDRMLDDSRADSFYRHFVGHWLGIRQLGRTMPDNILYPEYDEYLEKSMKVETELFFAEIVKQDLSLLNFIDSDFTFLNSRLATHYGIGDVQGAEFQRVALQPSDHRGGVMVHGSVLTVTADGTRTSPVLRGIWFLSNIMGSPPPPPPPNAPGIEPDIRGAQTVREQLDRHREVPACYGCHVKIDPAGLALEEYDPIGNWRDKYRYIAQGRKYGYKLPVDSSGNLPTGETFKNMRDLKSLILSSNDLKTQVASCLVEKLLTYGMGRSIEFVDRDQVEQLVSRSETDGYRMRTLLKDIIRSPTFQSK